jgi:hypothetical protein
MFGGMERALARLTKLNNCAAQLSHAPACGGKNKNISAWEQISA